MVMVKSVKGGIQLIDQSGRILTIPRADVSALTQDMIRAAAQSDVDAYLLHRSQLSLAVDNT